MRKNATRTDQGLIDRLIAMLLVTSWAKARWKTASAKGYKMRETDHEEAHGPEWRKEGEQEHCRQRGWTHEWPRLNAFSPQFLNDFLNEFLDEFLYSNLSFLFPRLFPLLWTTLWKSRKMSQTNPIPIVLLFYFQGLRDIQIARIHQEAGDGGGVQEGKRWVHLYGSQW